MYEEMTYDAILADMLSSFGTDVRTDEASLAYNACAKIAAKLEDVYADMSTLNDNMFPDTMDLDYLIQYGAERGITYSYATAPIVLATFDIELTIGDQFTCNDYTYTVTSLVENTTYQYLLTCETAGTEANTNFGTLEAVDYIDGYEDTATIDSIATLGTDDEDEDVFRARVLASFESQAFGGNKADYRNYIDAITGVGGCKPLRRASDSEYINIYLIDSDYGVPSDTLVDTVQTAVDPTENSGEGDGMAPICHKVSIIAVTGTTLDITATITFATGYSTDTSQSLIEAAIESYFLTLRTAWEGYETASTVVRISQIESAILTVDGVEDVTGTTIGGSTDNYTMDYTQIPILGEVTISV